MTAVTFHTTDGHRIRVSVSLIEGVGDAPEPQQVYLYLLTRPHDDPLVVRGNSARLIGIIDRMRKLQGIAIPRRNVHGRAIAR